MGNSAWNLSFDNTFIGKGKLKIPLRALNTFYPVLPVRTRDVDSSVGNIGIFIVYVVVEQDHFLILLA